LSQRFWGDTVSIHSRRVVAGCSLAPASGFARSLSLGRRAVSTMRYAIPIILILAGCASGAAKQTGEQKAEAGRDVQQTSSQEQWVVHALDAARERLAGKWQEHAVMAGRIALMMGVGVMLLLLCMPSPVDGQWRAILIIVALAMIVSAVWVPLLP